MHFTVEIEDQLVQSIIGMPDKEAKAKSLTILKEEIADKAKKAFDEAIGED